MNKKGQGISMTYVVIAALALIVLIIIVLFFTGGMERLFEKETGVVEEAVEGKALLISKCKMYCNIEKNKGGNCDLFCGDIDGDGVPLDCVKLGVKCGGGELSQSSVEGLEGKMISLKKVDEERCTCLGG